MTIELALIAVGIASGLVAAGVIAMRSEPGALKRRDRQLHRVPACATYTDVEWVLGRELPPSVATEVSRLAEERDLPPSLLWSWAEVHGPALLALAIGAGLDRRGLVQTKSADSELDRKSLEMQAELSSCLVGCLVVHALTHTTPLPGAPVASVPRIATA